MLAILGGVLFLFEKKYFSKHLYHLNKKVINSPSKSPKKRRENENVQENQLPQHTDGSEEDDDSIFGQCEVTGKESVFKKFCEIVTQPVSKRY